MALPTTSPMPMPGPMAAPPYTMPRPIAVKPLVGSAAAWARRKCSMTTWMLLVDESVRGVHGDVDVHSREDCEDERLQEAHEHLEAGHRDQQQERERRDHHSELRGPETGGQRRERDENQVAGQHVREQSDHQREG